jgi:hypothetical protein
MPTPINSVDKFHDALAGEDELGVVLRAHFYIEAELEALINALLPHPNELPRLRYEQKLKLACALGFDKSAFMPLKELGDLRNSFGHQIGAHLTEGMVEKLFNSFNSQDQSIITNGYNKSRAQFGDDLPSIESLNPKDRFVLVAIMLHKVLAGAVMEVRSNGRT